MSRHPSFATTYAALLSVFLLVACGDSGLAPPGGGDLSHAGDLGSGGNDLAAACASAHDVASCEALPGCVSLTCPGCNGSVGFLLCAVVGQEPPIACPAISCPQTTCGSITDGPSCDVRPDCYAEYSGDLPCDSLGCSNHFVSCNLGPSNCGSLQIVCNDSCATTRPTCPSGLINAFPASAVCCSDECVTADKCPPQGG